MQWIYLSPHLDDVALSCGGLIWEQARSGLPVSIWTICAGDPPDRPLSLFAQELHSRWGTGFQASQLRRQEDVRACGILSASYSHFTLPDCVYRYHPDSEQALYPTRQAIFGPLHPAESALVEDLSAELSRRLSPDARLVCPLTLGGHVDHQLTRVAAERLAIPLWYYADFPYAQEAQTELVALERAGWERSLYPISPAGMQAWGAAVAAHASQISTFWPDLEAMRAALQAYCGRSGGIPLWQPMPETGKKALEVG